MLKSTGVAGRPESYFRKQDEERYARTWNIVQSPDNSIAFSDYVDAALITGRSENRVFSSRIMWGTMDEVVARLAALYPEMGGSSKALLEHAFGQVAFIYLKRSDVIAQAVSRLRAEQTNIWHVEHGAQADSNIEPHYDFEKLQGFIQEADEHNAAWKKWFSENEIEPHVVVYEELSADPECVVKYILEFLGLELPDGVALSAPNKRMADELSQKWAELYLKDSASRRSGEGRSL